MTNNSDHIFSNVDIRKLLIPIMLENLLASLMGTVDTMMVSNVGASAVSAVSLVDSINILVIQALSALAAGGAILCSQYIGSSNPKDANRAARQVFLVMTVLSVFISAICLILRVPMLKFIFGSVEAEVMADSQAYFLFTLLSFPFIGLYDAGASIMRAQKDSKSPMIISIISNFLNIGGNAILIFGLGMGVAGAALSTLASRVFCAVVVCIYMQWRVGSVKAKGEHYVPLAGEVEESGVQKDLPGLIIALIPMIVLILALNAFGLNVVVGLFIGCVVAVVLYWKWLPHTMAEFWKQITAGAQNGIMSIANTAAVVGFGSIVTATPAFGTLAEIVQDFAQNGNAYAAVAISVVA